MKVIFTPEARGDFRAIVRWIGLDNLDRAAIFSFRVVHGSRDWVALLGDTDQALTD